MTKQGECQRGNPCRAVENDAENETARQTPPKAARLPSVFLTVYGEALTVYTLKNVTLRIRFSNLRTPVRLTAAGALALSTTACSLFFGNIRVDEKSQSYAVMDVAQANADWKKLPRAAQTAGNDAQQAEAAGDTVYSDLTFQSQKTHAIISINSSCRNSGDFAAPTTEDLKAQTKLLLLGISATGARTEQPVPVAEQTGLETTVEGKISGNRTRIRTVVLRKAKCQYDLMYIAQPAHFAASEALFSQFVASLRLR